MTNVTNLPLRVDDNAREQLRARFEQVIAHVRDADDLESLHGFRHYALGMIETCTTGHSELLPNGVSQLLDSAHDSALARLEVDVEGVKPRQGYALRYMSELQ